MTATHGRKRWMVIGGAGLVTLAWLLSGRAPEAPAATEVAAQQPKPDLTKAKFYGVTACNKCHTEPGKFKTDFVLLNEYKTWRTKDRHALAYAVLEGPRGQQMADILGYDVTKDARCLNCHATTFRPNRMGKGFRFADGVSCDGCHGPAEHWLAPHAFDNDWRTKTPEEKEALGMFDVRNPVKRAEMCMSCHVGNAAEGKVVTHTMYAAGHPPLPSFELAAFSRNLPPHWLDLKDVPFFKTADAKIRKAYHVDNARFEHTKLALATSKIALRVAMDLIANRGTLNEKAPALTNGEKPAWPPAWLKPLATNEPKDRWPELGAKVPDDVVGELRGLWPEVMMAQSDCFACHHDLTSKSWRQERGYVGRPGRPQSQPWTLALAPLTQPAGNNDLAAGLRKLHSAFDLQPFGEPGQVAPAAAEVARCTHAFRNPTDDVTEEQALALLRKLVSLARDSIPDFDSARQIAWAFRAIYPEWAAKDANAKKVAAVLDALDHQFALTLNSKSRTGLAQQRYDLSAKLAVDDDAVEKAIKDRPGFLVPLQRILDQELAVYLERLNAYDPAEFRRHMEELGRL
ncbi:MAG: cytochrome c family protein [Gemmataceae bacterium]|nr:cytochrome c family protein [Gemmataceae bacterium]